MKWMKSFKWILFLVSLVNDHVKIFFKGDKGLILVREQSTFPSAKKRKSKKKKKVFPKIVIFSFLNWWGKGDNVFPEFNATF